MYHAQPNVGLPFERVQAENRGSDHIKVLFKESHIFDALENE